MSKKHFFCANNLFPVTNAINKRTNAKNEQTNAKNDYEVSLSSSLSFYPTSNVRDETQTAIMAV